MRLLLRIVCGLISFIQAQKPGADEESSATGWAGHVTRFHLAGSARAPTLSAQPVSVVLGEVPDQWRAFFAAAVFTACARGSCAAFGSPTSISSRGRPVRRSYARDTTKGGHADVIPVAPALLPHVAAAIDASPSELVFPASDGTMLSEDTNTERVLRSALARAGIVIGYDHTCRRCKAKGMSHVERQAEGSRDLLGRTL